MKKANIICIIDNSGSMSSSTADIINSFNTFCDNQREERGEATLTLVLFNSQVETLYTRKNIKDVQKITRSEYRCANTTAMYDAIGVTLKNFTEDNTYVIIQTDGHENASRNYTKENVKSLIKEKKAKGWEFLFMAADIDAKQAALPIGLENEAIKFSKGSKGIETAFSDMSGKASNFRCSLDAKKLYPAYYKVA